MMRIKCAFVCFIAPTFFGGFVPGLLRVMRVMIKGNLP